MSPEPSGPAIDAGLKKKLVVAMLKCFEEAPELFVAVAPDLYVEVKSQVGAGPRQRAFEGYVTEREESERGQRLQSLLGQRALSREEAAEVVEHFVALGARMSSRDEVIGRIAEPMKLDLSNPRNDTLPFKRDPVMRQDVLVPGVIAHVGFDGRLIKIQLLRDDMERRNAALSLCGTATQGGA